MARHTLKTPSKRHRAASICKQIWQPSPQQSWSMCVKINAWARTAALTKSGSKNIVPNPCLITKQIYRKRKNFSRGRLTVGGASCPSRTSQPGRMPARTNRGEGRARTEAPPPNTQWRWSCGPSRRSQGFPHKANPPPARRCGRGRLP